MLEKWSWYTAFLCSGNSWEKEQIWHLPLDLAAVAAGVLEVLGVAVPGALVEGADDAAAAGDARTPSWGGGDEKRLPVPVM